MIARLGQGTFTESDGSTRQLCEDDFMVVAPYNARLRRLCAGLACVVGTVDKFQGQRAPIVEFRDAGSLTLGEVARGLGEIALEIFELHARP